MTASAASVPTGTRHGFRQLDHYPGTVPRVVYLAIVVIATISLYYELYIQGAVAPQIMTAYGMSFPFFVFVSIIGNLVGALGSLAAGIADQFGRANIVGAGLFLTGVLTLFGLPMAPDKIIYLILFAGVSVIEGAALVATPALIRDFSPQLGRAKAMAFWTLGPVVGSLVVTEVTSHTLAAHPAWQFQFHVCGIVGLVVCFIALVGLRELSPQLRNQLMVSARDKALIEARAAGIDIHKGFGTTWRAMMKSDILISAIAISVFLSFYYLAVGVFVVFFATTFGYTGVEANGLLNWFWLPDAIALIVAGILSDLIGVRKPFMVAGAIIAAIGVAIFYHLVNSTGPTYDEFKYVMLLIAVGTAIAYGTWMASYSETVEKHNPAATATGLAVWGGLLRGIVTVILIAFALTMTAATALVDHGGEVQALATKYAPQLATLQKIHPATLAALKANPKNVTAQVQAVADIAGVPVADVVKASQLGKQDADQLATLAAVAPATLKALQANPTNATAGAAAVGDIASHFGISPQQAQARLVAATQVPPADLAFLSTTGAKVQTAAQALKATATVPPSALAYLAKFAPQVQAAAKDNRAQWNAWWIYCFIVIILFIPTIFLMAGRWSPAAARRDEREHEARVKEEMAKLGPKEQ